MHPAPKSEGLPPELIPEISSTLEQVASIIDYFVPKPIYYKGLLVAKSSIDPYFKNINERSSSFFIIY